MSVPISNARPPSPAVLLVAFNRPETTRRVFAALRAARPPRLFLACDAARPGRPGEAQRVAEVRALAGTVDWPCEVRTRFAETNLGCGQAVSSAVTWFLDEAGEGAILEDDCLPTPAFFRFCSTMLARHRSDGRIALIAGSNMSPLVRLPASHGFSRVFSSWGWATWRRAWDGFSLRPEPMKPDEAWTGAVHPNAVDFLRAKLAAIAEGRIRSVWDYQFMLQVMRAGKLAVVPAQNLVLNVGFDGAGTHFGAGGRPWAAPAFAYDPDESWTDLPPVVPDERYDRHFMTAWHRGSSKLSRQIQKFRTLWNRRRPPADAVLKD